MSLIVLPPVFCPRFYPLFKPLFFAWYKFDPLRKIFTRSALWWMGSGLSCNDKAVIFTVLGKLGSNPKENVTVRRTKIGSINITFRIHSIRDWRKILANMMSDQFYPSHVKFVSEFDYNSGQQKVKRVSADTLKSEQALENPCHRCTIRTTLAIVFYWPRRVEL